MDPDSRTTEDIEPAHGPVLNWDVIERAFALATLLTGARAAAIDVALNALSTVSKDADPAGPDFLEFLDRAVLDAARGLHIEANQKDRPAHLDLIDIEKRFCIILSENFDSSLERTARILSTSESDVSSRIHEARLSLANAIGLVREEDSDTDGHPSFGRQVSLHLRAFQFPTPDAYEKGLIRAYLDDGGQKGSISRAAKVWTATAAFLTLAIIIYSVIKFHPFAPRTVDVFSYPEFEWKAAINSEALTSSFSDSRVGGEYVNNGWEVRSTSPVSVVRDVDAKGATIGNLVYSTTAFGRGVTAPTYVLKAGGLFTFGNNEQGDAECTEQTVGDRKVWLPNRGVEGADTEKGLLDLVAEPLSSKPIVFDWVPEEAGAKEPDEIVAQAKAINGNQGAGCSPSHHYVTTFAPRSFQAGFGILLRDPERQSLAGTLNLELVRDAYSGPRNYQCPKWTGERFIGTQDASVGEIQHAEVMMDSRNNDNEFDANKDSKRDTSGNIVHYNWQTGHWGIFTCNYLMPDVTYEIHVQGHYTYKESVTFLANEQRTANIALTPTSRTTTGLGEADAECSTGLTGSGDGSTWIPKRALLAKESDIIPPETKEHYDAYDLWLGTEQIDWIPETNPVYVDKHGIAHCSADHQYYTRFTPKKAGPVSFKIYDIIYEEEDNDGLGEDPRASLCMQIHRLTPDGTHLIPPEAQSQDIHKAFHSL